MKETLQKFIEHLESCGLLVYPSDTFDYEKVIYHFQNYEYDHSGTVIMITKKEPQ